mmetsp:Transcript_25671/g.42974  ORF Transcript_25671/g.42974 Transcript_25671/m.42974 type:complete len:323 (+) Transcript_25671:291-1259(+)|eukprot:CAMPEP_0198219650 /NCGR_PEP_ID=MMETSP1445-20131203/75489_1 /TAXON_ID=36898 /ORGANISM="Pyramimonas sp., Strain CCMP2087" /LENGTH=322 /DNA_ID=CAMNT_0043897139 /DNA_START=251 /DNA_END=1222 /DNA_ORIENTATION=-
MDKAQARSQWRTHQHQKKKGRGRGGGEGGAAAAPVSGKHHRGSKGSGPSEGLGSNFDRYDEETEEQPAGVPVRRSTGADLQALLDEAALHVSGSLSRQQAFDTEDAVEAELAAARGPESEEDTLAFNLDALSYSLSNLPLHEVLGLDEKYIPSCLRKPADKPKAPPQPTSTPGARSAAYPPAASKVANSYPFNATASPPSTTSTALASSPNEQPLPAKVAFSEAYDDEFDRLQAEDPTVTNPEDEDSALDALLAGGAPSEASRAEISSGDEVPSLARGALLQAASSGNTSSVVAEEPPAASKQGAAAEGGADLDDWLDEMLA